MHKKKETKLSIPADNSMVSIARLTASALANRIGFNIEEIDDIKIAVAEASKHIIKKTKKEEIQIIFYVVEDKIELEIKDIEDKFKDSKLPEKEEDYSENMEMYILKNIMDEFLLKSGEDGSIIYMSKKLIQE